MPMLLRDTRVKSQFSTRFVAFQLRACTRRSEDPCFGALRINLGFARAEDCASSTHVHQALSLSSLFHPSRSLARILDHVPSYSFGNFLDAKSSTAVPWFFLSCRPVLVIARSTSYPPQLSSAQPGDRGASAGGHVNVLSEHHCRGKLPTFGFDIDGPIVIVHGYYYYIREAAFVATLTYKTCR